MNTEKLQANLDKLNAEIKTAYENMKNASVGIIEETVKEFLYENPMVEGIHWCQYVPYFNDGEECFFRVCDICYHLSDPVHNEDFSAYESDEICDNSDLEKAIKNLEEAKLYNADKDLWVSNYTENYKKKWGRAPYHVVQPYPSTVEAAEKDVQQVKEKMEKYDQEAVNKMKKDFKSLVKVLNKIPDETMEAIYGNHVYVIINRQGTTIEEHSHD